VRAIDELLAFDDIDDDVLGGSLPATDRCRVLHRREPLRERSSPAGASSLASEAKGQKFRAARISRAQALEHCRALAKEATNLKVEARQHAAAFARCSSRRATLGTALQELEWTLGAAQDAFPEEVSTIRKRHSDVMSELRRAHVSEKMLQYEHSILLWEHDAKVRGLKRMRAQKLRPAEEAYFDARLAHGRAVESARRAGALASSDGGTLEAHENAEDWVIGAVAGKLALAAKQRRVPEHQRMGSVTLPRRTMIHCRLHRIRFAPALSGECAARPVGVPAMDAPTSGGDLLRREIFVRVSCTLEKVQYVGEKYRPAARGGERSRACAKTTLIETGPVHLIHGVGNGELDSTHRALRNGTCSAVVPVVEEDGSRALAGVLVLAVFENSIYSDFGNRSGTAALQAPPMTSRQIGEVRLSVPDIVRCHGTSTNSPLAGWFFFAGSKKQGRFPRTPPVEVDVEIIATDERRFSPLPTPLATPPPHAICASPAERFGAAQSTSETVGVNGNNSWARPRMSLADVWQQQKVRQAIRSSACWKLGQWGATSVQLERAQEFSRGGVSAEVINPPTNQDPGKAAETHSGASGGFNDGQAEGNRQKSRRNGLAGGSPSDAGAVLCSTLGVERTGNNAQRTLTNRRSRAAAYTALHASDLAYAKKRLGIAQARRETRVGIVGGLERASVALPKAPRAPHAKVARSNDDRGESGGGGDDNHDNDGQSRPGAYDDAMSNLSKSTKNGNGRGGFDRQRVSDNGRTTSANRADDSLSLPPCLPPRHPDDLMWNDADLRDKCHCCGVRDAAVVKCQFDLMRGDPTEETERLFLFGRLTAASQRLTGDHRGEAATRAALAVASRVSKSRCSPALLSTSDGPHTPPSASTSASPVAVGSIMSGARAGSSPVPREADVDALIIAECHRHRDASVCLRRLSMKDFVKQALALILHSCHSLPVFWSTAAPPSDSSSVSSRQVDIKEAWPPPAVVVAEDQGPRDNDGEFRTLLWSMLVVPAQHEEAEEGQIRRSGGGDRKGPMAAKQLPAVVAWHEPSLHVICDVLIDAQRLIGPLAQTLARKFQRSSSACSTLDARGEARSDSSDLDSVHIHTSSVLTEVLEPLRRKWGAAWRAAAAEAAPFNALRCGSRSSPGGLGGASARPIAVKQPLSTAALDATFDCVLAKMCLPPEAAAGRIAATMQRLQARKETMQTSLHSSSRERRITGSGAGSGCDGEMPPAESTVFAEAEIEEEEELMKDPVLYLVARWLLTAAVGWLHTCHDLFDDDDYAENEGGAAVRRALLVDLAYGAGTSMEELLGDGLPASLVSVHDTAILSNWGIGPLRLPRRSFFRFVASMERHHRTTVAQLGRPVQLILEALPPWREQQPAEKAPDTVRTPGEALPEKLDRYFVAQKTFLQGAAPGLEPHSGARCALSAARENASGFHHVREAPGCDAGTAVRVEVASEMGSAGAEGRRSDSEQLEPPLRPGWEKVKVSSACIRSSDGGGKRGLGVGVGVDMDANPVSLAHLRSVAVNEASFWAGGQPAAIDGLLPLPRRGPAHSSRSPGAAKGHSVSGGDVMAFLVEQHQHMRENVGVLLCGVGQHSLVPSIYGNLTKGDA
jgi:hypothetical protein